MTRPFNPSRHELKLHIRGAINNGLTRDEVKEVFDAVDAEQSAANP